MNNLGIFYNFNLKKSSDINDVFDKVLYQTSDLVEKMDNYQDEKKFKKNSFNNKINDNKKKENVYSINNKEYENDLVNQIDNLLNPFDEFNQLDGMFNNIFQIQNRKKINKKNMKLMIILIIIIIMKKMILMKN